MTDPRSAEEWAKTVPVETCLCGGGHEKWYTCEWHETIASTLATFARQQKDDCIQQVGRDLKEITGLDWEPLGGLTLAGLLDQHTRQRVEAFRERALQIVQAHGTGADYDCLLAISQKIKEVDT